MSTKTSRLWTYMGMQWLHRADSVGLRTANDRRRYKVTPSLIGWAQTENRPCYMAIADISTENRDVSWYHVMLSIMASEVVVIPTFGAATDGKVGILQLSVFSVSTNIRAHMNTKHSYDVISTRSLVTITDRHMSVMASQTNGISAVWSTAGLV